MEKEYDYAPLAAFVQRAEEEHGGLVAFWYAQDLAKITEKHSWAITGTFFARAAFYAACGGEVAALASLNGFTPADIVHMTITD